MSIDEQRGDARPDARDADGPEVIGEAPIAEDDVDSGRGEPTAPLGAGVQASTSDPQSVVWPPAPNGAPTQPMSPANQPNPTLQHPVQPSPYGRPADEPAGSPTAVVETDPWAQPTNDPWLDVTPGSSGVETVGAAPQTRGRRLAGAVGLFAAGAVVGGLVTGAYTGWGSNDASAPASQPGQVQGQAGQPGGQAPGRLGGPAGGQDQQGIAPNGQSGQSGQTGQSGQGGQGFTGGQDGEVRLVGTLTAVKGSKITVRSATSSAAYTIAPTTRIVRDGAAASASDLQAGDLVLVHAFPRANTDAVLELVYARSTSASGGTGGAGGASSSSSGDDSTT